MAIGERVSMGQRLSVIVLGSLVAVVLPGMEDVLIEVKTSDRITAGVSALTRYETDGKRKEH